MKFRYEQAKKEEGVIEEENVIRSEFGLNTHVLLMIIYDEQTMLLNPVKKEKTVEKKKTARNGGKKAGKSPQKSKKKGTIEIIN